MAKKKPVKQPVRSPEEQVRLKDGIIRLAEGMIEENVRNYALVYADTNGTWHMAYSDRTWGMGAARRLKLDLEAGIPRQERDE